MVEPNARFWKSPLNALVRLGWPYFAMLPIILLTIYSLVAAIPTSPNVTLVPNNDSLLWGPYRPNLYFGLRPRVPDSLLIGLMWSNADDPSIMRNSKF